MPPPLATPASPPRLRRGAWARARAEHDEVVAAFLARVAAVPPSEWHVAPSPRAWSPAAEALHVTMTYELGAAAVAKGGGMRLRVSPARATLLRTLLLPLILRLRRFPRGAPAPPELRPDMAEAQAATPELIVARCRDGAEDTARALQAAGERGARVGVVHAYFGPLSPLATLRLLSAHTRHHAARFGARR